jgi:hypothetical protein
MNAFDFIDPLLISLTALRGPKLLIAFVVVLGYGLKLIPSFPNKYIPAATLCAGPILAPFIVAWPQPGDMEPNLRYNEAAAWIQIIIMGVLLSSLAWATHAKILRKLIDDKLETKSYTPEPGKDTPTP